MDGGLDQAGFGVRFGWGLAGVEALGPGADVVVVVDVLSFSTAVEVAVARGAAVLPCRWGDERAGALAAEVGAALAVARDRTSPEAPYSLSPTSLAALPPGARLVLPSPNGATVALAAAGSGAAVLAGCLRNATAVARAALRLGKAVAVVAAGERRPDGSLRPAVEDLLGAGAVLAALDSPAPSPEARAAAGAFRSADLPTALRECASGRELARAGYADDVAVAARLDASDVVPVLSGRAFVALDPG